MGKFLSCLIICPTGLATIMDKSSGILLHFWGVFQFRQAQPLPSPYKQRGTRVSRFFFFSEFQLCMGWEQGDLQENLEKDALFYEGTQKLQKNVNTAFLSQGLVSTIV